MRSPKFLTALQKSYIITQEGKSLAVTPVANFLNPGTVIPVRSEMITMENVGLERWLAVDNKNYLVYSISDKKKDELVVYLQELSGEMTLLGSPVKLATFTGMKDDANKVPAYLQRYHVRTNFIHVYSSENGKELVMVKQRKTKVELKAFSLDKGPLWSKTFDLTDKNYEITNCVVTDNRNTYLLGAGSESEPFLIAYNPSDKTEKMMNIKTGEKIYDFGYKMKLIDGTLYLAGLSDIPKSEGTAKQVGYQILSVNTSQFALEKIANGVVNETYEKYMRKLGSQPQLFSVSNIIRRSDGGITFSIEGGMTMVNKQYGWKTWIYSALGLISLGKDGSEQWNTAIEKEQVQGDTDTYVGHNLFSRGSKVYVLYNDNPDNFDLPPTVKPKDRNLHKKIYVCLAEIDETGKAKKLKPLTKDRKQFSALEIDGTRKIKENLYQVLLKVDDKYHFATLNLE